MGECINGKTHDFDSCEESDYCANGCGEKWALFEIKKLKAENTRLQDALGSIVDKYFDLPHEFRLGPARLKESRESLIAREALKEQV